MANRRHPDPNRTPSRDDRKRSAPGIGDLDPDEARDLGAELDRDGAGDPNAGLDTDETDDNSTAAEQLSANDEPLDQETSEELGVDNVVGPQEAGIGGGLDEQEEARAGITDEELEEIAKKSRRC